MVVQICYGWKGIPQGEGTWKTVHVPDETWQNKYEPWTGEDNRYVGYVHEDVDTIVTRVVTLLNDDPIASHESSVHVCRVCGARSDKDWS